MYCTCMLRSGRSRERRKGEYIQYMRMNEHGVGQRTRIRTEGVASHVSLRVKDTFIDALCFRLARSCRCAVERCVDIGCGCARCS